MNQIIFFVQLFTAEHEHAQTYHARDLEAGSFGLEEGRCMYVLVQFKKRDSSTKVQVKLCTKHKRTWLKKPTQLFYTPNQWLQSNQPFLVSTMIFFASHGTRFNLFHSHFFRTHIKLEAKDRGGEGDASVAYLRCIESLTRRVPPLRSPLILSHAPQLADAHSTEKT